MPELWLAPRARWPLLEGPQPGRFRALSHSNDWEVCVKEAVVLTKTEPRQPSDAELQKQAAEWANAVKALQVELADLRKLVRAAALPQ